jgi:lysophospholipase
MQLYYEQFPAAAPARGTLLFVHGYGDHCGRYGWPIEHFAPQGLDCLAFDYRGHGQAAGTRGHCYHFDEYLGDLDAAIELAESRCAGPLVIVGHSHGGLVAMRYLLAKPRASIRAIVLSSPFFALRMSVPAWKRGAARMLSRIAPRLAMPSEIQATDLSHEPSIAAGYKTDRWVHSVATTRWFTECHHAQQYCYDHAGELALPVLALVAGDDRVVSADRTRALFDRIGAADKQLVVYPGYYHEIFNETGRAQVFSDLGDWLQKHL